MTEPVASIELWVADLATPNYRVRWAAAQALGRSRDPGAVEPLMGALNDRLPTIRCAALAALGRLRDPRAIPAVLARLHDPDSKVRTGAAAALKKMGKAAHAPMLAAYRTADSPARFALLSALGQIRSDAVSELLIAALDDASEIVRVEAARVLGARKDRRAVERLLKAVEEEGPYRFVFIRALGAIGDPGAFEPLQALLEAPVFALRAEVVTALRSIDNARAVDLFHEQLDGPASAERDRLAQSLAGIDLLNAACSLARDARATGDLTMLGRALAATSAMLGRLPDAGEPNSEFADSDASVSALRRLEWFLRDLNGRNGSDHDSKLHERRQDR